MIDRQITIRHHRPAPIPTPAPDDMNAARTQGVRRPHDRPDVEIVPEILHRDLEGQAPARQILPNRLHRPIPVPVLDVPMIAEGEKLRIETRVIGKRAPPRADAPHPGPGLTESPSLRRAQSLHTALVHHRIHAPDDSRTGDRLAR